jgi:excisionase family DNA binding protein
MPILYQASTGAQGYSADAIQGCITGALMELVTMTEAARRLGVSTDTVKRRLRRGELKGRKRPRPQGFTWLIELEAEVENGNDTRAATHAHTDAGTDASTGASNHLEDFIASLQSQVAAQQAQLVAKDHQIEIKDRQIEQLHILLQQAQAALPVPKEDRHSWWDKLWHRNGR